MKKIVRKNQIVITALAVMIVVAGYLNFTGQSGTSGALMETQSQGTVTENQESGQEESSQEESSQEKSDQEETNESNLEGAEGNSEETTTDLSAEDLGTDSYEVGDNGEVVASEENPGESVMVSNTLGSDYFASAKLTREQSRAKNKETLMEIINNESIASSDKKEAISEVAKITGNAEKESAAELLLEAKGFTEAMVSIEGGSADVVVNANTLTSQQIAQIEDIVRRKTNIRAEKIVITPVGVEKE